MRHISGGLALAMVIVVFTAYAGAAIATQGPAPADKSFQGTLVKVDTDMRVLTAKGADGKEMYFNYEDDTKVVGPAKDVQGLSGKPGANLKITYHIDGAANRASRIEMLP
jgi:hypothetical protein